MKLISREGKFNYGRWLVHIWAYKVKSSDCKPCPTGSYCVNGEVRGLCDAGYFCLAGSSSATPNEFDFDDLGLILRQLFNNKQY